MILTIPTIANLRRLCERNGGLLEEDEGYRDMRVLQVVAPDGQVWEEGVKHLKVEWQRGNSDAAQKHNHAQMESVEQRLNHRDMTPEEADMCAED